MEAAVRLLDGLLASGIELREPPGIHTIALQLADQLQQGAAYDAHYLALAEIPGREFWTADERFNLAATSSFNQVRWLGSFSGGPES